MPSFPSTPSSIALLVVLLVGCGGSTTPSTDTDTGTADTSTSDTSGVDTSALDTSALDTSALDTGPKPDAPPSDGGACFGDAGDVPSVPYKVCTNDTDCTTAHHQADCCGSFVVVGVVKSEESAFLGCEKAWQASLPKCKCPAAPMKTEDGKTVTDPSAVVVKCADRTGTTGLCKTSMP